jgi:hypothetical protein
MQKKISELNEASTVEGNDYFVLNQGVETKKVSMSILNSSLAIPSTIELLGSVPSTISVSDNLPNSITLDASSVPSTISVSNNLPNSIAINWGAPPTLSVNYRNIVGGLVNAGPFQVAEDIVVLDDIRVKCDTTAIEIEGSSSPSWPVKLFVGSSANLGLSWKKIDSLGVGGGIKSLEPDEPISWIEVSSVDDVYQTIEVQIVDTFLNKIYKVSMQSKNEYSAYIFIEKIFG